MQLLRIVPVLAVLVSTLAFAAQPLQVAVGAQRVISTPGLQRVALGNASLADVRTAGQDVVLIGVAPGRTELRVWKSGASAPEVYEVTVTAAPSSAGDPTPITFTPTLQLGAKTSRAVPGLQRIAVGDPDIADLSVDDAGVTLAGKGAGQTNVLLWFADGRREQWVVKVLK